MTCIAIPLLPFSKWEEWPAVVGDFEEVRPDDADARLDLGWREDAVERALARQPRALLRALGLRHAEGQVSGFRQVSDADVLAIQRGASATTAFAVELKKEGSSESAKATMVQFARNLPRIAVIVRDVEGAATSVWPIICGDWTEDQIQRARRTVAWRITAERFREPSVLIHAAVLLGGRTHILLGESLTGLTEAMASAPSWTAGLADKLGVAGFIAKGAFSWSRAIGSDLKLNVDVLVGRVVVALSVTDFTLRDKYLSGERDAGAGAVGTVLAAKSEVTATGFERELWIGQRLALRFKSVERLDEDEPGVCAAVHRLVDDLLRIAGGESWM